MDQPWPWKIAASLSTIFLMSGVIDMGMVSCARAMKVLY